MSIFGSLSTGVLGLTAQSRALGHIADNIANSQTVGYKRVDSAFETLVLQSSSRLHAPGGVIAKAQFQNGIQGGLTQVQSATNLAIQGQGFFTVTVPTEDAAGQADLFYTRVGDWELDEERFLTNSNGFRLNGFVEDPDTGEVNTFGAIQPIQIANTLDRPVPTSEIDLFANLPATPKLGEPAPSTTINVFDDLGRPQELTLKWRQQAQDDWRLIVEAPSSLAGTSPLGPGFDGQQPVANEGAVTQGRPARKQVDTITFGTAANNIQVGETYTVNVNGTAFSQSITADNVGTLVNFDGVADALAAQINSSVPSPGVQATTVSGGELVLTANNAGTGFSSSTQITDATKTTNSVPISATVSSAAAGQAQITQLTFSETGLDVGDSFTVSIIPDATGVAQVFSLTATTGNFSNLRNVNGVAQTLADQINADPTSTVVATTSGPSIILTGKTATAAASFTLGSAVSNGSLAPNTVSSVRLPTNVTGIQQSQTISLSGGVGDIGANFQITVRSPTQANFSATTSVAAATSVQQVSTATFDAAATLTAGQEYRIVVDGTTYSTLITDDNVDTLINVDGVISDLVSKINNDFGSSVTASAQAGGSGGITLTAKFADDSFTVTQPSIQSFNQLFQLPQNQNGLNGTTGNELTIADIATTLATQINGAGLPISATVNGGTLTVTSTQDDVAFDVTTATSAGTTPGHVRLQFGGNSPTGVQVPAGTIRQIGIVGPGGTAVAPTQTNAGDPANVRFTVDFGAGPQEISLNLGAFQRAQGVTQFAGETVNVSAVQQNGSPRGQFKNVEINDNGDVLVNFDNGRSRVVAKVPLTLFNNPNALQRENGGVFSQTANSGEPNGPFLPTQNGTGQLVPNSLEQSNVDIADEFTKLIVTQRTYTANSRIVTTSDEMLQEALNLKR